MSFQALLRPDVTVEIESGETGVLKKVFLRDVLEEFKKRNDNRDIDQVSRDKFKNLVELYLTEREDTEDQLYQQIISRDQKEEPVEMPLQTNKSLCKQITCHLAGYFLYDQEAELHIRNILIGQLPLLSLNYNFSDLE